jgi:putative salt-induced outer membrane protein YdiY
MITRLGCIVFALAAPAAILRADTVSFTNGDQLRGTIVSMVDGKLEIDSAVAGRITVPMSLVSTFATDEETRVVLDDGTAIHQKIESSEAGKIAVSPGGTLVAQSVDVKRVRKINPPAEGVWHGQVKADLDIDRGNTDKGELDGELSVGRETSHDLLRAWGTYEADNAKQEDGDRDTTKRDLTFGTRYQHNLTPRSYWYTQNVMEREATADLDLRLRLGGGLGRRFFDTEKYRLTGEAGLAWVHESFTDEASEDDSYIAGRIAWDALRRVGPRFELFHSAEWFPSLESFKDHLFQVTAGARTRLTQNISLESKVIWDYDSTPAEDAERLDAEYLLSLIYDF